MFCLKISQNFSLWYGCQHCKNNLRQWPDLGGGFVTHVACMLGKSRNARLHIEVHILLVPFISVCYDLCHCVFRLIQATQVTFQLPLDKLVLARHCSENSALYRLTRRRKELSLAENPRFSARQNMRCMKSNFCVVITDLYRQR